MGGEGDLSLLEVLVESRSPYSINRWKEKKPLRKKRPHVEDNKLFIEGGLADIPPLEGKRERKPSSAEKGNPMKKKKRGELFLISPFLISRRKVK